MDLPTKHIYLLFVLFSIIALLLVWFAGYFILSREIAENCEHFLSALQAEKDGGRLADNIVHAANLIIRSTVYGYMEICYWLYSALIYITYLICMNYLRLKYHKTIRIWGIVSMVLTGLLILLMATYNPLEFKNSLKRKREQRSVHTDSSQEKSSLYGAHSMLGVSRAGEACHVTFEIIRSC